MRQGYCYTCLAIGGISVGSLSLLDRKLFVVVVNGRALFNGGEGNGGYATFVWQERAQTRATQMTHMPSLKPLFCCVKIKAHCVIGASFACHRRKKRTPHLGPPPFNSDRNGWWSRGSEKVL